MRDFYAHVACSWGQENTAASLLQLFEDTQDPGTHLFPPVSNMSMGYICYLMLGHPLFHDVPCRHIMSQPESDVHEGFGLDLPRLTMHAFQAQPSECLLISDLPLEMLLATMGQGTCPKLSMSQQIGHCIPDMEPPAFSMFPYFPKEEGTDSV